MPFRAGFKDDDCPALLEKRLYDAGCNSVAFPCPRSRVEGDAYALAPPGFSLAVNRETVEGKPQCALNLKDYMLQLLSFPAHAPHELLRLNIATGEIRVTVILILQHMKFKGRSDPYYTREIRIRVTAWSFRK